MNGQVTIPRLIDFIAADLDVLREFWRIRRDKKSRINYEDVKTFVGKLDILIEFWKRLQILNRDENAKEKSDCMKCALLKGFQSGGKPEKKKRKENSCQTEDRY